MLQKASSQTSNSPVIEEVLSPFKDEATVFSIATKEAIAFSGKQVVIPIAAVETVVPATDGSIEGIVPCTS